MSFIPVIQYLAGLVVFGAVYWIMDGILTEIKGTGLAVAGDAYNLLLYLWVGIIIIYLIFGGWWVVRKYNERQYMGGNQ